MELLRGGRNFKSEDLRELSLILAGWMIHLGGKAEMAEDGYARAKTALEDGSALRAFLQMVAAQGGDTQIFDDPVGFHRPGATVVVPAWDNGYIAEMDTTKIGWAVQRTGAGREKAGEPVDPHAGIEFHARRGAKVERGQPIAVIYATTESMLLEPSELIRDAILISATPPEFVPLVSRIFTYENAESHLRNAIR
jgi:pyrimidine-nucleoside phosphorylase